jgi:hypothetical protein
MRFEKMKKSVIIKISAVVIAIAVLLALVGLMRRPTLPSVPSFQFLSGRNQGVHAGGDTANRQKRYVHSFEADFNDVCADAHSELTALGYVETTSPGHKPGTREYMLRGQLPGEFVAVKILDNNRLTIYSTPEHSGFLTQDVYAYHYREGFVIVDVTQRQYQLKPIYQLKYWRNRLFP